MSRCDCGLALHSARGTSMIPESRSLLLSSALLLGTMGCRGGVTAPAQPCTLPVVPATELDSPLQLISMRDPEYPPEAIHQGHQGTVFVRTTVDHDGSVCKVVIHSSPGYAELDSASVAAARTARFAFVWSHGRAVRSELLMPIEFRLAPLSIHVSKTRVLVRKVVQEPGHNKLLHPASAEDCRRRFDGTAFGARG